MNTAENDINIKNQIGDIRRQRIKDLISYVNSALYDKENIVKISVLAVLAGQNVFLYGPPGTAKSMLSRRIADIFKNQKYFEHLMHRFCTPEELFGPISLQELKKDIYNRKLDGYLADADFAFLDEIWKSSPAVLNTLLTLINEHKYHNGNAVIDTPLKSLISASNEIPSPDDGLSALFDRFLVRLVVNPIEKNDVFRNLIKNLSPNNQSQICTMQIDTTEYIEWLKELNDVELSDECADAICYMRSQIEEYLKEQEQQLDDDLDLDAETTKESRKLSYISDRRWLQTIKLIKASAFFNGQSKTELKDLMILKNALWSEIDEIDSFAELVTDAIERFTNFSSNANSIELPPICQNYSDITDKNTYWQENLDVNFTEDGALLINPYYYAQKANAIDNVLKFTTEFNYDDPSLTSLQQTARQNLIDSLYVDGILGKEVNSTNINFSDLKPQDIIKIQLSRIDLSSLKFVSSLGVCFIDGFLPMVMNDHRYKTTSCSIVSVFLPTRIYNLIISSFIAGFDVSIQAKVSEVDIDNCKVKVNFQGVFKIEAFPEKRQRVEFHDEVEQIFSKDLISSGTSNIMNSKQIGVIKQYLLDLTKKYPNIKDYVNQLKFALTKKGDILIYKDNKLTLGLQVRYVNHFTSTQDIPIYWEYSSYNDHFQLLLQDYSLKQGAKFSFPKYKRLFASLSKYDFNFIVENAQNFEPNELYTIACIVKNAIVLKKEVKQDFTDIWIFYEDLLKQNNMKFQVVNINRQEIEYEVTQRNTMGLTVNVSLESGCSNKFHISTNTIGKLNRLINFYKTVKQLNSDNEEITKSWNKLYNTATDNILSDIFIKAEDKNILSEVCASKSLELKNKLYTNKQMITEMTSQFNKFKAVKNFVVRK